MDAERQARVAENESVFRQVNERIEEAHERLGVQGRTEFVCECGHAECAERIFLTLEEYEAVRSNPRHFAIVPGHDIPGAERVVDENERFVVVEKFGAGGRIAEERDPRR